MMYGFAAPSRSSKEIFRTRTAVAAWIIAAGLPFAAGAVSTPSVVEPGKIERRFTIEKRPELNGAPVVSQPENGAMLPEGTSGPSFELRDITVKGSTAFNEAELKDLYKDILGKKVTLGEVRAAANKITAYYRNNGYILSRAIVPPQTVENGVVTLQVIEGYIDGVSFEGAERQDGDLLASYAANITAEKPASNSTIERYVLLVDDLSGVHARAVLAPSTTNTGASHLTIVLDSKPVEGEVFVNNRGSRFLGSIQEGVRLETGSLLGQSERIQLRTIASGDLDELRYYEASYQQPVGSYGTSLRAQGSFADTAPGASLQPLDVRGESVSLSFAAQHPFQRSRRSNLLGNLGFRYHNSSSEILSFESYDDHVRSIYAGLDYDTIDSAEGINRMSAELSHGLDVLDSNRAGDLLSRANGDTTFTKMEASYTRIQALSSEVSVLLQGYGQYAFDPLLASEELSLGSEPFGSAYDPSEISGDSGFAGRVELRYSNTIPETIVDVYQLYAFYDGGRVWNRGTIPAGESSTDSMTSTGVGLRLTLAENISSVLEVAKPLTRDVAAQGTNGNDVRGFFSLVYSY